VCFFSPFHDGYLVLFSSSFFLFILRIAGSMDWALLSRVFFLPPLSNISAAVKQSAILPSA
jgi:hypothetical protein